MRCLMHQPQIQHKLASFVNTCLNAHTTLIITEHLKTRVFAAINTYTSAKLLPIFVPGGLGGAILLNSPCTYGKVFLGLWPRPGGCYLCSCAIYCLLLVRPACQRAAVSFLFMRIFTSACCSFWLARQYQTAPFPLTRYYLLLRYILLHYVNLLSVIACLLKSLCHRVRRDCPPAVGFLVVSLGSTPFAALSSLETTLETSILPLHYKFAKLLPQRLHQTLPWLPPRGSCSQPAPPFSNTLSRPEACARAGIQNKLLKIT